MQTFLSFFLRFLELLFSTNLSQLTETAGKRHQTAMPGGSKSWEPKNKPLSKIKIKQKKTHF